MEREVSKVIPVAKSITKFEKENIGNELVIVDGWHIVKYAEEYKEAINTDNLEEVYKNIFL